MRHSQLYRAARLNPTSHRIWFHSKSCRVLRIQCVNNLVAVRLIGTRARHASTCRRAVGPRQVHFVAFARPRLLLVWKWSCRLSDAME